MQHLHQCVNNVFVCGMQVIGFLMYLADGEKVNINKLKHLNLSQVDTIFKVRMQS